MPADKDAAKRRRQARNRQERAARQARTEGAKRAANRPARTATEAPPARAAKGGKGDKGGTTAKGGKAGAAAAGKDGRPSRTSLAKDEAPARSGGLLGTLFPPRPQPEAGADGKPARSARPPSQVVEVEGDGVRAMITRLTAQPGGRPVVLALFAAVVSALTLVLFPVLPSPDLDAYGKRVVEVRAEVQGEDIDDAVSDFRVTPVERVRALEQKAPQAYIALLIGLVPVIITAVAARSLTRPTRSRTLMVSAIGAVMLVFFAGGVGFYFLLVALALGWGAYQSAKADKAALAASG